MPLQRKAWAVLVGTPTVVEVVALATGHPEWTLSPQLRWALRTHTPRGAMVSALAIGAGASWLAYHLTSSNPRETP